MISNLRFTGLTAVILCTGCLESGQVDERDAGSDAGTVCWTASTQAACMDTTHSDPELPCTWLEGRELTGTPPDCEISSRPHFCVPAEANQIPVTLWRPTDAGAQVVEFNASYSMPEEWSDCLYSEDPPAACACGAPNDADMGFDAN